MTNDWLDGEEDPGDHEPSDSHVVAVTAQVERRLDGSSGRIYLARSTATDIDYADLKYSGCIGAHMQKQRKEILTPKHSVFISSSRRDPINCGPYFRTNDATSFAANGLECRTRAYSIFSLGFFFHPQSTVSPIRLHFYQSFHAKFQWSYQLSLSLKRSETRRIKKCGLIVASLPRTLAVYSDTAVCQRSIEIPASDMSGMTAFFSGRITTNRRGNASHRHSHRRYI